MVCCCEMVADLLAAIGKELCIDSDGFFELEQLPRKVAVVGAGYIAVELAGVLNALGADTTIFTRRDGVLRSFDVSGALVPY